MRNKISIKIITCVVVCSILISAVVGITGIKGATSVIKKEAYGKISSIAESRGNKYSIEIQKTENTVKEYAKIISDSIDASKVNDVDYMNTFQSQFGTLTKSMGLSNKGITGLYINFNPEITGGDEPYDLAYYYDSKSGEGNIWYNSYTRDDYHEDNEKLSWYYEPIKAKEGVWSKPYVDPESDNIKMISYTMPVYKDNQLLGVAGLDISFENLQKMILDTSLYDTGNAFLLDKDYSFIVDKDKTTEDNLSTMEDGKYNFLVEDIKNKKESVADVNFEGKETLIGYYTLSNGQIIGVRVPTEEVFRGINDLTFVMVGVIVLGIIISIIFALYIGGKISKPIETATRFIQKLAKLDLTESDQNINRMVSNKDETGLMVKSLIKQRDELTKIIKVLKQNALEVLQHSEMISDAGNETVESIGVISITMEELAGRAEEQAKEVRKGSYKLEKLANEIDESVGSISKLEKYSLEMQKMKEKGSESIDALSEKLKDNVKVAMSVEENINELLKKSNLIGEIITMIGVISKKTSILSLNASIESEKAGQSGKSFSVISDEIRKLAESSAESTSEIQNIVKQIQNEITLGKCNMDGLKAAFEEVIDVMIISNEVFKAIGESVNNTMEQIRNLVLNMKKVDKDKDDVLVSIEEISLITEELVTSVENVTKSIGRQESAMQSSFERTEELRKVSETLSMVVEKFKD